MGKDLSKVTTTFQFCDGGSCRKAHSELSVREARAHLRNADLWHSTHTIKTRCNGRCEDAPTLIVQPGNFWYKQLDQQKVIEIVEAHTTAQSPVEAYLLFKEGAESVLSDRERKVTPVVFKPKVHEEYGTALVARASASDQFLYPVLKTMFEKFPNFELLHPIQNTRITTEHQVKYTDAFDLMIKGPEAELAIAIGPITKAMEKEVASEILSRKVGVSEVYWFDNHERYQGAIHLKNRKGKPIVNFLIPKENQDLWTYLMTIYLEMTINSPRIADEVTTN